MSALVPFNSFVYDMANGANAPGLHTIKLALTNTAPDVTWTRFSQVPEIPAGNGYPAGGLPLTVTSNAQVGGFWSLFVANAVLVASGGVIPVWRWAVVYDTSVGSLIGFSDYGIAVGLSPSELVNFVFDQVNGLITGVATSG